MKKLLSFLCLGLLFGACHKGLSKDDGDDSFIPANFDWATLQRSEIELDASASVYEVNKEGNKSLIGENLQPGTYSFSVTKGSKLETGAIHSLSNLSRAGEDNNGIITFPNAESGEWATMLFEDTFPWMGDMDLNDVVFYFRVEYVLREGDNVDHLNIYIRPVAMGGNQYKNIGLAIQLAGVKQNYEIKQVDGQYALENSVFNVGTNGVEQGQNATTIIPLIGNLYECFDKDGGIINTYPKLPTISTTQEEYVITVTFGDFTLESKQLGVHPDSEGQMMDLFITLGERGKEVHQKGHPATNQIDKKYEKHSYSFTSNDEKNNLVWAIILPNSFKYAQEGTSLFEVYPNLIDWVYGKKDSWWSDDGKADGIYIPTANK